MAPPDLPTQVLLALDSAAKLPLISTEAFPGIESNILKGALDSLLSREMVVYETIDKEVAVLTEEAEGILRDGSHEAKVYDAVCAAIGGLAIKELPVGFFFTGCEGEGADGKGVESCGSGGCEGGAGEGVQGGVDQEGWRSLGQECKDSRGGNGGEGLT